MFAALLKAIGQASDPAFRRVLGRSLAAAIVAFAGLWGLSWFGLSSAGDGLTGWLGEQDLGAFWIDVVTWIFGAAGVVGVLVTSFFLFPAVMVLAMSLLLEDIAAAVERRHYPDLPPARAQPLTEQVKGAVAFAGVTLAANLLALPVYLLLLFVPPLNLFVFYALNGYLLGREYFELVAVRRLDPAATKRLRRHHRGRVLLAGVVVTVLLTLPLVNLVTPIIATGFMLHVFEALRRRGDSPGAAAAF
ncbi:MAG: EI24 domain-containing protein [Kiloniellaceae bacterium]